MNSLAAARVTFVKPKGGARSAPGRAMLTYFTATSRLPRLDGSTEGMGLVVAQARNAARAADAPIANAAGLATRNVVPQLTSIRVPIGGAALLDILV